MLRFKISKDEFRKWVSDNHAWIIDNHDKPWFRLKIAWKLHVWLSAASEIAEFCHKYVADCKERVERRIHRGLPAFLMREATLLMDGQERRDYIEDYAKEYGLTVNWDPDGYTFDLEGDLDAAADRMTLRAAPLVQGGGAGSEVTA